MGMKFFGIVIPVVVGSNPIAHPNLSMTYLFFLMKNIV